jgi:hypothetical protein
VNDETGEPTPVRLRLAARDGTYLPPFGRLADFPTGLGEEVGGQVQVGKQKFAYIDGTCEVALPEDTITVDVSKGPEYRPLHQQLTLGEGQLTIRLDLERWADLRPQGWYAGDVWSHCLSPQAALLEGAAEGLAVVNLLAMQLETGETNPLRHPALGAILEFSGQKPAVEGAGCAVVVNTLNLGGPLDRLILLNCHRAVYPLSIGPVIDWALADWCDQCHRKAGLVLWPHAQAFRYHADGPPSGGEALADLVLGKIDGLAVDKLGNYPLLPIDHWYPLLNSGFRVPITGGSAKLSNRTVLGSVRTYAQLKPDEAFSYTAWIEAIRAGRTFVTNGPLVTFTVDGQGPGAVLSLPTDRKKIHVRAEARSLTPFERLEIVHNGEALAAAEASGSPTTATLEGDLELPATGWLAARCRESVHSLTGTIQPSSAHTSPIYVEREGEPFRADMISVTHLLEHLDHTLTWAEAPGRFATDKLRDQVITTLRAASEELFRRIPQ